MPKPQGSWSISTRRVVLPTQCAEMHDAGLIFELMPDPPTPAAGPAATSANVRRPLRAATGALTTTIAVSIPVFLVGGLAVQISDELGFTPAGLGLAVSAYFGASALASVPAGGLVERYGSKTVSRAAIG